jgi:hypothetical protein
MSEPKILNENLERKDVNELGEIRRTYVVDASVKFVLNKKVVEELTRELAETLRYDDKMNAVLVEKLAIGKKIKNYLHSPEVIELEPEKQQVKIERAPGFALFGFLSTICSKKFVERELCALLADGNVQYQELLASGDTAGAWRWKWSMRVAMVSTVFRGGLGALLGLVRFKAQSSE